jgi:hypothetical protein
LLLLKRGEAGVAFTNVALSVVFGLLIAWFGYELTARAA